MFLYISWKRHVWVNACFCKFKWQNIYVSDSLNQPFSKFCTHENFLLYSNIFYVLHMIFSSQMLLCYIYLGVIHFTVVVEERTAFLLILLL